MTPVFKDEMQFLAWGDGPAGPWIKLLLPDSDALEPFRGMTAAKKGMAGQRLAGVLVEISDQETPKEPEPAKPKGGELAKLAGILCADPEFQEWLFKQIPAWCVMGLFVLPAVPYPTEVERDGEIVARDVVRRLCGVDSRAELDHDEHAALLFHDHIRKPWAEFNAK